MNRRELLKAIPAVAATPLIIKGKEVGKSMELSPDHAYIIFLNGDMIDIEEWCSLDHGPCLSGTPVYAVFPNESHSMDDLIRIFEVK